MFAFHNCNPHVVVADVLVNDEIKVAGFDATPNFPRRVDLPVPHHDGN